ncbi:MAG: hypothetical protein ACLTFJ_11135 [Clostridium sp.]
MMIIITTETKGTGKIGLALAATLQQVFAENRLYFRNHVSIMIDILVLLCWRWQFYINI